VSKIAALVPADTSSNREDENSVFLDGEVIMAVDHLKPKLTQFFHIFCNRHSGSGARNKKHKKKTRQAPHFRPGTSLGTDIGSLDLSVMSTMQYSASSCSSLHASDTSASDLIEEEEEDVDSPSGVRDDVGSPGSVGGIGDQSAQTEEESLRVEEESVQAGSDDFATVPQKKRANMSLEQFLMFNKELMIVPDMLSRLEVIAIFKRSQNTTSSQGHGSSLRGLLSCEEFIDATTQIAIAAYSKEPFANEHPNAHKKIEGFFKKRFPADVRELRERFLYGSNRVATGSFMN
jgi:hypothetical protein